MQRKLIRSIRALAIAAGFASSLVLLSGPAPVSNTSAAGVTASAPIAADAAVSSSTTTTHKMGRKPRAHQTMALPFFSFAKALRRGNRG